MADKAYNIPEGASPHLKSLWARLPGQYEYIEKLKFNQANRGPEGYERRMAHRAATHKTWRQMKGVEKVMFELRHKGNYPFVFGFAAMTTVFMSMYFGALKDPEALKGSTYYQRFHAPKSDH
mmetsp:Transcript_21373/g.27627  ORF Transcript_21373/g.27627 Transcript_21373/m.27627 type:complete len:122 (+) Transcript_21373:152-517(+)|eukprot:CAMPEP_0198136768 /NCGR_PEP_ID=MMETSP1443-20131203/375_1 /TAXON_ID=186043 /ORGANISM="Entomoneis sp., Strain CCMP2396" /LENGTH=121 /DNA_ID=CAMNT_0043798039 /DNA_START=128 /DNA_END=493 /DNA_ORIENTATION=+